MQRSGSWHHPQCSLGKLVNQKPADAAGKKFLVDSPPADNQSAEFAPEVFIQHRFAHPVGPLGSLEADLIFLDSSFIEPLLSVGIKLVDTVPVSLQNDILQGFRINLLEINRAKIPQARRHVKKG